MSPAPKSAIFEKTALKDVSAEDISTPIVSIAVVFKFASPSLPLWKAMFVPLPTVVDLIVTLISLPLAGATNLLLTPGELLLPAVSNLTYCWFVFVELY